MKRYINGFLICTMLFQQIAWAKVGSDAGNGGGAHYCADGRVEMYDLVEGRLRFGKEIDYNMTPTEAMNKVKAASPLLHQQIERELGYVETHIHANPAIKLFRVQDADLYMTEKDCEYKQLANWDSTADRIHIDDEIFQKMDSFNQFALKFHEAAYKVARDNGATNSNKVRRFVAEVFSKGDIETEIISNQFARKVLQEPKLKTYSCADIYLRNAEKRFDDAGSKMAAGTILSSAAGLILIVSALPVAGEIVLFGGFAMTFTELIPGKDLRSLKVMREEGSKKLDRIFQKALTIYPEVTKEDVKQIIRNGFISGDFCYNNRTYSPRVIKKYTLNKVRKLKEEEKK